MAATQANSAVQITDLIKTYGSIRAVDGISLTVPSGKIYGIIGPSGAGKTTLIRAIVGAIKPSSGEVRVLNRLMPDNSIAERIGYMTQSASLYADLSLRENLNFYGRLYGYTGGELKERVESTAALVALQDRLGSPVRTFSGGMQRRSALAVALLHEPDLMVLDEPTAGLDPVLRERFWGQFNDLASQGRSLIVSSHVMDEAERATSLAFIRDGKLLATGSPDEMKRQTGTATMEEAFLVYTGQDELATS